MSSYISKSKFEVSRSASASPSPGFGLSLQTNVVTEICSELGCGVIDGVGGYTKCLRDGICPELQGRDILSESEKVVKMGVPLQRLSSKNMVYGQKRDFWLSVKASSARMALLIVAASAYFNPISILKSLASRSSSHPTGTFVTKVPL